VVKADVYCTEKGSAEEKRARTSLAFARCQVVAAAAVRCFWSTMGPVAVIGLRRVDVLGPVTGLALWLRDLRGVGGGCSVRTAFPTSKVTPGWPAAALPARLHDRDSATREDLGGGARGPGQLEWCSWGFNAARGRCSGQLRSK
jgi:hypothetical protein